MSDRAPFYNDENGEAFWVKAADCSLREAIDLIDRSVGIKVAPEQVARVKGFEYKDKRTGEPRFMEAKNGVVFWKLVND